MTSKEALRIVGSKYEAVHQAITFSVEFYGIYGLRYITSIEDGRVEIAGCWIGKGQGGHLDYDAILTQSAKEFQDWAARHGEIIDIDGRNPFPNLEKHEAIEEEYDYDDDYLGLGGDDPTDYDPDMDYEPEYEPGCDEDGNSV
jgi:hypothetical protein